MIRNMKHIFQKDNSIFFGSYVGWLDGQQVDYDDDDGPEDHEDDEDEEYMKTMLMMMLLLMMMMMDK